MASEGFQGAIIFLLATGAVISVFLLSFLTFKGLQLLDKVTFLLQSFSAHKRDFQNARREDTLISTKTAGKVLDIDYKVDDIKEEINKLNSATLQRFAASER